MLGLIIRTIYILFGSCYIFVTVLAKHFCSFLAKLLLYFRVAAWFRLSI